MCPRFSKALLSFSFSSFFIIKDFISQDLLITSFSFFIQNTTNNYTICNTYNYINPSNILFNNYYLFDSEILHHTTYITHLYFNHISSSTMHNTFHINIYKNFHIFHTIIINTNSNKLYKFIIPIMYYKNDILQIYIKSIHNTNNSIKVQLFGYHKIHADLIGDSNFLTDTPIYFNNTTTSDVKLLFNNNINIHNSLVIHNNSNYHFTINKLSSVVAPLDTSLNFNSPSNVLGNFMIFLPINFIRQYQHTL